MAVVLSSEEDGYFSTSSLRRSHSQPKLGRKQGGFHTSSSTSRIGDVYQQPARSFTDSAPSSAPSSPRAIHVESSDLSCSSTPPTTFSLGEYDEDDDGELHLRSDHTSEQIILPHYGEVEFYNTAEDLEPPPSPRTGDSYTASPNEHDTSTSTSRPDSPDLVSKAEDDTAVRAKPSRHVDYLSHDWREEDIWESWKHIVSRRGEYTNSARLENASWRTWMKAKNNLKTVSPETLNWLKDCDVTWLYGPLQSGQTTLESSNTEANSSSLSKSNSFLIQRSSKKKPILKKRSMSEIMLQRSLSASSLVKQAAAAVQAQQKEPGRRRPGLERAATDYVTFAFSTRRLSHEPRGRMLSVDSSGLISPSGERKHIHFNEQVEQCIAVDVKGDEEDEDAVGVRWNDESDSDDGAIMMKRTNLKKKKRPALKRSASSSSSNTESKTIAMLPSTTLKYREDTPEPTETAMKHSTSYRSPLISPSSSQETLKPSRSGKLFFAGDESDEEEDDEDEDDEPTTRWRSSSKLGEGSSGLQRSASTNSLTAEPAGMRRTPSGMFMPYEEGESAPANEGIIGRVIDTVNTARDIAHVIWNVGWRK